MVALDEPWPVYYGGVVAAPTFAAIARQVLLYWGVPPQPGCCRRLRRSRRSWCRRRSRRASRAPTVQLASAPPLAVPPRPSSPLPVLEVGDAGEGDALDGPVTAALTEALDGLATPPTHGVSEPVAPRGAADSSAPLALPPVSAGIGTNAGTNAGTGGGAH